jgi:hypothetical protein
MKSHENVSPKGQIEQAKSSTETELPWKLPVIIGLSVASMIFILFCLLSFEI